MDVDNNTSIHPLHSKHTEVNMKFRALLIKIHMTFCILYQLIKLCSAVETENELLSLRAQMQK